ncbi:uncharacterized protein F5891DRAFT_1188141 [Suillus fuscotomentosus]|uniref:Uncharacterized protein n=1 Tax=Suillus fuscotomentosus TaxID=1912939 RepID=A0AAD4DZH1_9AGAM|nr:uncharacterized protein F5891DRAFT_1192709 [Suillus fuscotomentosus]XP_041226602.1 uncharacterized protein F5891DRAFT_1188141 [Suillus fuscotomentosus]KAG1896812.1 hypothetical protein F5891DRAFT_1192709 [Suillus fuscotomentosus]KAG1901026.1 hypothetical protein F5891DRAFT_1188141 [Suillus fuscotomentosus]
MDSIFRPCIEYQRGSTELVIFSREVKQLVTVAYPKSGRFRIRPYGLADYLQRRGLFIECFCGMLSDTPCSTRIVDSAVNGHVLMQCANEQCGFRANITDIYHTSFFTSSYEELPTLVANPQPNMNPVHDAFRQLAPNEHDIAPYFHGYLGSHVSVWPDFRQLRGLVGAPSANPRPFIRLVHRRAGSIQGAAASQLSMAARRGQRVSTRLPLGQDSGMVVMNRLSAYETGLLADLSGETGVFCCDGTSNAYPAL